MELPVLCCRDCSFIIYSINAYIKNLLNVNSQGDRFVVFVVAAVVLMELLL